MIRWYRTIFLNKIFGLNTQMDIQIYKARQIDRIDRQLYKEGQIGGDRQIDRCDESTHVIDSSCSTVSLDSINLIFGKKLGKKKRGMEREIDRLIHSERERETSYWYCNLNNGSLTDPSIKNHFSSSKKEFTMASLVQSQTVPLAAGSEAN